jgi:hypothetical protein
MDTDLMNDLNDLSIELPRAISRFESRGREQAQTEHDYKVVLSQEALKLRADGMPVTLIDKVVYGVEVVADKRLKRDIADALYNAERENINSIKLQIRILDNQISREWGEAGRNI